MFLKTAEPKLHIHKILIIVSCHQLKKSSSTHDPKIGNSTNSRDTNKLGLYYLKYDGISIMEIKEFKEFKQIKRIQEIKKFKEIRESKEFKRYQ